MAKPSIYSKTRNELRRDLALAVRLLNPEMEVKALAASIGPEGKNAELMGENGEETG